MTHLTSVGASGVRQSMRFGDLCIEYDDRVLTPRPWTEIQSRWATDLLRTAPPGPVLELCSGAGHIGLLAVHGTDRRLVAVDANPAACDFIAHNAVGAELAHHVEVRCGDLSTALADDEQFALVIADPPWVPSAETGRFPEDPLLAIDGGDDGLDVARCCLEVALDHLAPGGTLLLQLGNVEQAEVLTTGTGWALDETRHGARGVVVALTPTASAARAARAS